MEEENKNKIEDNSKKSNLITIDDFSKLDLRVGKILSVEKVPETDKLLKLEVDMAEDKPRQIVSGISEFFPDISVLVGKKCMFVVNLEPRIIKGLESQGMILAVSTDDGKFSLLEPNDEIPVGTKAK
ncbi:MAG: methionine--tRNA ligase subunit beta [Candidatus Paceibacterota bacterium]|jgi:methionyl-tRNA synthetase